MESIREELTYIKKRNGIFDQLNQLAVSRGYTKVESDYFEDYIEYINQNKRQRPETLVKVPDLRGNMFVLKPDITTNIIKQVIPRIPAGFTEKFYYLDNIFSYNASGMIEKTRQFGIEMIGSKGTDAEIETIAFISTIFSTLNIEFVLEVGNQKWVEDIIESLLVTEQEATSLRDALLTKNKDELKRLLSTNEQQDYLVLLQAAIDNQDDISSLIAIIEDRKLDPSLLVELNRMKQLKQQIEKNNIIFDLSLLNPFDYYNGPIYRGYIPNVEKDVVRGGRYDYLTKEYGVLTPALGFSIDIDVLIKEVYQR